MKRTWLFIVAAGLITAQEKSALDRYIEEAGRAASADKTSGGSLFLAEGPLAELSRDARARYVNDLVTILVTEQATATSKGTTSSKRKSSAKNSISALYG